MSYLQVVGGEYLTLTFFQVFIFSWFEQVLRF
jgi:hypothetical protein